MCEQKDYSEYRLYILVKEEYPPSVAINSAVHGGMAAGRKWQGEIDFEGWYSNSFKKITCMVNEKELANANKILEAQGLKKIEQTESRLGGAHILTMCYPFNPKLHEFKAFKFFRTYKWGE
jgi:hypothetical protein